MIDNAAFFKEERIFSAAYRKDTCLWGPDIADMLVHSNEGMNLWRPNFGFLPFIVGRHLPRAAYPCSAVRQPRRRAPMSRVRSARWKEATTGE
jgi:hypothetical protein